MCLNSPLLPVGPVDEVLRVQIGTSARMIHLQGEVVRILAEKFVGNPTDAFKVILNREGLKVEQRISQIVERNPN